MLEQPSWLAKQYQIYALVDPRDQTIRYVGVSNDVKRRFYEHLQCIGNGICVQPDGGSTVHLSFGDLEV